MRASSSTSGLDVMNLMPISFVSHPCPISMDRLHLEVPVLKQKWEHQIPVQIDSFNETSAEGNIMINHEVWFFSPEFSDETRLQMDGNGDNFVVRLAPCLKNGGIFTPVSAAAEQVNVDGDIYPSLYFSIHLFVCSYVCTYIHQSINQ